MISSHRTKNKNILLLDGGISTHLEKKLSDNTKEKKSPFSHRELWSSSLLLTSKGRQEILNAHLDFLTAGSDVISTVTYQLSHFLCEKHHETSRPNNENTITPWTEELVNWYLRIAFRIATESLLMYSSSQASSIRERYILASIGSYGGALSDGSEYTGQYGDLTFEALKAFHQKRFDVFMNLNREVVSDTKNESNMDFTIGDTTISIDHLSHIPIIAFETIPCAFEVEAILSLLKDYRNDVGDSDSNDTKAKVWLCVSCRDGDLMNDGTPLNCILDTLNKFDPEYNLVQGIGVNCVALEFIEALVEKIAVNELNCGTNRTIILYPNSGEEWDSVNQQWREDTGCTNPTEFADVISKCISSVYKLCREHRRSQDACPLPLAVGGCCRTGPDTILALRNAIDENFQSKSSNQ